MLQMKEHGKNPQDQTCKKEIGSLPEKKKKKEFRVMKIKIIQNLENKIEA